MRGLFILLVLLPLTGCGPRVIDGGPRSVTVFAPLQDRGAQDLAEAHCQAEGLHARVAHRGDRKRIVYDCVP